jgi:hypothetical protein
VSLPAVALTGSRAGHRVGLTWSFPNAISYQLTVRRDGRAARILLGPTSATSAVYNLEPGHSYSFSVTATDSFGRTQTSSPYSISLPYTGVKLELRTSSVSGRPKSAVRFWSAFNPADRDVARAGRRLSLEAFDGASWRRISVATTSRSGIATWTLALRHGTYRIRVRYAGALAIAPATSRPVTIRT